MSTPSVDRNDYSPTTEDIRDSVVANETGGEYWKSPEDRDAAEQKYGRMFDRWFAGVNAEVAAKAWDEGARSRQCRCEAWSAGECACGNYPSEANPYREAGR